MKLPDASIPTPRKRKLRSVALPRTLDLRGGIRGGALTSAEGVDPRRLPEIAPLGAVQISTLPLVGRPTGMAALGGRLYVTALDGERGVLHCLRDGVLLSSVSYEPIGGEDEWREIVQFNVYSNPADPLSGEYRHMGIVFPDGIFFPLDTDTPAIETPEQTLGKAMPRLSHICVHLSRLFGTAGDRIYASAYNDPQDWNVDTATDAGAQNAWAATVQSNTAAGGDFTALAVFGGQLHAFKEGFCHILSGTKNPFRVGDLFPVGAACPRSVAEVGGKLFFADRTQVYRYNGDALTPIGDALGERVLTGAVGCAGDGMYYLCLPTTGEVFVYAVESGAWSALGRVCEAGKAALMTESEGGPLLLDTDGNLYALGGTGERGFTCTLAPFVSEGEELLRLCRLFLAVDGEAGDSVVAAFRDLSGREHPLLRATLSRTGLSRLCSRMFTPADRGGGITLSVRGRAAVQRIELATETESS